MPTLIHRLDEAIRAHDAALETTPFVQALAQRTLPRERSIVWVRVLRLLHETLEALLVHTTDPLVRRVWHDDASRSPLLERYLALMADATADETMNLAELRAMVIAQELRYAARSQPARLLGALYLLEHSMPGRAAVLETMARGLDTDASADDELASRDAARAAHVRALVERMDAQISDEDTMEEVVNGAVALGRALEPVLRDMPPQTRDEHADARLRVLNPEAGTHPITEDLREMDAALRAGEHTWNAFPYYETRYGARGRRYTRSDSAWLVALCRLEPSHVWRHISWLGQVLAARGMPRLMLEQHLLHLYDALCEASPEARERYRPLYAAHAMLHKARVAIVSDAEQKRLAREFDEEYGTRANMPRIAELLIAAVADEQCGVVNAVSGLYSWLAAEGRLEESFVRSLGTWLETVRAVFATLPANRADMEATRP